jgi:hypothetical protein
VSISVKANRCRGSVHHSIAMQLGATNRITRKPRRQHKQGRQLLQQTRSSVNNLFQAMALTMPQTQLPQTHQTECAVGCDSVQAVKKCKGAGLVHLPVQNYLVRQRVLTFVMHVLRHLTGLVEAKISRNSAGRHDNGDSLVRTNIAI